MNGKAPRLDTVFKTRKLDRPVSGKRFDIIQVAELAGRVFLLVLLVKGSFGT